MRRRRTQLGIMVTVVAALALALPAAEAGAQRTLQNDPSTAQYETPIPDDGGTEGASASGAENGLEANIGFLPFTGFDMLVVTGLALVLTGTGFALRRFATPRPPVG